jgi:hypothetical protein
VYLEDGERQGEEEEEEEDEEEFQLMIRWDPKPILLCLEYLICIT